MPRKSVYKKRAPARKRQAKKKNYFSRVPMQMGVVSSSQIVKLRYVERLTLDSSIATLAYDTFSATSCYDPYVAAGGHQPLGFDEWMNFYEHYMVLGSKITAIGSQTTAASADAYLVAELKPSSAASTTNITTILEQKGANYRLITGRDGRFGSATVTAYYSPKKFFNLRNPRDEQDLRGTASSNPVENAYFQISVTPSLSSTDPSPVEVLCTIEYTVLLTERKPLAQS